MPFVPGHGLQEEGGDRLRALELDRLLQVGERGLRVVRPSLHPVIRVQHVHDAADPGLVRPPAGIAGELHRSRGRPVVAAVAREDLLAAGHELGDLHRVLVRLGAAEREEHLVHVARHEARELLPQDRAALERHERRDVGQLRGLLRDRVGHAPVAVTDVHAHQLGVEVEVALAVGVPEVDALGALDRDRRRDRLQPASRTACSASIARRSRAPVSDPTCVAMSLAPCRFSGSIPSCGCPRRRRPVRSRSCARRPSAAPAHPRAAGRSTPSSSFSRCTVRRSPVLSCTITWVTEPR